MAALARWATRSARPAHVSWSRGWPRWKNAARNVAWQPFALAAAKAPPLRWSVQPDQKGFAEFISWHVNRPRAKVPITQANAARTIPAAKAAVGFRGGVCC